MLYKGLETADIQKKRLKRIAHLVRMNHGRVVKRIHEKKREGRRTVGRPRLRWLDDDGKDLQDIKVKEGSGQRRKGL